MTQHLPEICLHVQGNNPSEAVVSQKLDEAREHAAGLLTEIQV